MNVDNITMICHVTSNMAKANHVFHNKPTGNGNIMLCVECKTHQYFCVVPASEDRKEVNNFVSDYHGRRYGTNPTYGTNPVATPAATEPETEEKYYSDDEETY